MDPFGHFNLSLMLKGFVSTQRSQEKKTKANLGMKITQHHHIPCLISGE